MSDIYEKLLILRSPGVGPATYNNLVKHFGDVSSVVDSLKLTDVFKDTVKREIDLANQLNIVYLSDIDSSYPCGLRDVKNHPPVISVRGNIDVLGKKMVSIVGTRHATANGMGFIANLAMEFANNEYAVVSGMAIGTDTAAHIGALKSYQSNVTIAVMGGGVDYIWPLENESLYYQILERGAVISEMPVGYEPKPSNFVQRNRWVAALGEKLILSEADLKSGSMKTADFALNYGKQVYAVPSHPSDLRSVGPNSLIRDGRAKLCSGVGDFFDQSDKLNVQSDKKLKSDDDLLDKLGTVPLSESVLAELVKKTIAEIKTDLVILELQGLVRKTGGGYIRI